MLIFIGEDMMINKNENLKLEKNLIKRLKKLNLKESLKSLEIAKKFHKGKRKNGFEEISHQYQIVDMTIPLFNSFKNSMLDTLVSSLFLHDIIEDYRKEYNFLNLKNDFSKEIFDVVKRMTKTEHFNKTEKDYIKYYKSLEKNPLSVIGKLLDRIHNFETMSERTINFKLKYFIEVEKYLIPMSLRTCEKYEEYEEEIKFLLRQLKILTFFNNEIIHLKELNKINNT